jgi:hypothetical protein
MEAMHDDRQCPRQEDAVGWALYAVEPEQENAVRAHLAECPICQEVVRDTEQIAALLGGVVAPQEPPAALRERLLAAVDRTPQCVIAPEPTRPESAVVPIDLAERRRRRRSRGLLAAAAAVVLLLGAATAGLAIRVGQLSHAQQTQAAQEARVQAIVTDPTAHRIVLSTASGTPSAMLVTSRSGAAVVPIALTPNGADHSYVAWGLLPSGPRALTRFDVTAGDIGPQVVDWPASADGLTQFAISLEPGRNLPAKPTDVVASGAVA